MDYVIVKWVHVMSSTILFGAGVGSAFHLFMASRRRDSREVAGAARQVVLADWLLTAPAAVIQPVSGLVLVELAGFPLASRWVALSILLYAFAILCWLPVVVLQLRMRDVAVVAAVDGAPLPASYWRLFRAWTMLGVAAFLAFVAVFYLMVAKPQ